MVDVGHKSVTRRVAVAQTLVLLPDVLDSIFAHADAASAAPASSPAPREWHSAKGPVVSTAVVAGTCAVKATSSLIPFCHPLPLERIHISVGLERLSPRHSTGSLALRVRCEVACTARTGVEMEALTGASVAALTVYDMLKALSHDIVLADTRLVSKTGGKSDFAAPQAALAQGGQLKQQEKSPDARTGDQRGLPAAASSGTSSHAAEEQQSSTNAASGQGGLQQGDIARTVLRVHDLPLNPLITADTLCTLFGVYGNVLRVKLTADLSGALVEFADAAGCRAAQIGLNGASLGGAGSKPIRTYLSMSTQVMLQQKQQLRDDGAAVDAGGPKMAGDYTQQPARHRFRGKLRHEGNKHRPTRVLHVSNLPHGITEQQLQQALGHTQEMHTRTQQQAPRAGH